MALAVVAEVVAVAVRMSPLTAPVMVAVSGGLAAPKRREALAAVTVRVPLLTTRVTLAEVVGPPAVGVKTTLRVWVPGERTVPAAGV